MDDRVKSDMKSHHDDDEAYELVMLLVFAGDTEDVERRIAGLSRKNWQDESGKSFLHWACLASNAEMAQMLLNFGVPCNLRNEYGELPIHCACECANYELIELLLRWDRSSIEARDKYGDTPLITICRRYVDEKQEDCVRCALLLLDMGASVMARSDMRSTPLHEAAIHCNVKMAEMLLEQGADIEAIDENGDTPLLAMSINIVSDDASVKVMAEFLLSHGANCDVRNCAGEDVIGRLKVFAPKTAAWMEQSKPG